MSAVDHIKIAAAELTKAAADKRQEARELMNETHSLKFTIDENIRHLNNEIAVKESEVERMPDDAQKSTLRSRIIEMRHYISKRQNDHTSERNRLEQAAKSKEIQAYELDERARSIENLVNKM